MKWQATYLLGIISVLFIQSVNAQQVIDDTIELPLLGMDVSEQEQQAIKRAIEFGREISRIAQTQNGLPYRRDAHAKATGCLRATFSVNGDIMCSIT